MKWETVTQEEYKLIGVMFTAYIRFNNHSGFWDVTVGNRAIDTRCNDLVSVKKATEAAVISGLKRDYDKFVGEKNG